MKSDDCYTFIHNFFETDEIVFCPECIDLSNYEEISEEDVEFFVDKLNIEV